MHSDTPNNDETIEVVNQQDTPILSTQAISINSVPETPRATNPPKLLIEVFPINIALPSLCRLIAYQLEIPEHESAIVGGKLAYQCNETLPGLWLWTEHRLVTDTIQSNEQMKQYLATRWQTMPDVFSGLLSIRQDEQWKPTAQACSDYVARCLCGEPEIQNSIQGILHVHDKKLNAQVYVQRRYEIRGRPVQGQPALSLSISSRVLTHQDLRAYAQKLTTPENLVGTQVVDRRTGFKGEIISVYPERATAHRERLLGLTPNSESQAIIMRAADDELVVRIRPYKMSRGKRPGTGYDYVASALHVTMKIEASSRFGVSAQQVLGALRLSPEERSTIVKNVSMCLRTRKFIHGAFNSDKHGQLFLQGADYRYSPFVLLGGNHRVHGETIQREDLRRYGFYSRSETCPKDTPIRVCMLTGFLTPLRRSFWESFQKECRAYGFDLQLVKEARTLDLSRHCLEGAIEELREYQPQIILGLFPDESNTRLDHPVDYYNDFKVLTIGRGIPSQVVMASTLTNTQALINVALGSLSKLGNIPFRLAEPLPYTDIIVGLDIARNTKAHLAGSINVLATAQIYQDEDATLKYHVEDAQIEGETIPDRLLQSLLPSATFAGKRILIHRDGWFRGNERQALKEWAQRIGATINLVEIVKSGVPRFYRWLPLPQEQQSTATSRPQQDQAIYQPPKGSAFRLNDQEAYLVSSLPPYTRVTPYPLHIRAEPPLRIENALHSVLTLTLLHYGSVRSPRLPVTTHYSDKMAYLALQGIRPPGHEGKQLYWL